MLVENLVSMLLLVMVLASVFQSLNASRRNALGAQQRTYLVGLARTGLANAAQQVVGASVNSTPVIGPLCEGDYKISTNVATTNTPGTWNVKIRVTKELCTTTGGQPLLILNGVVRQ